MQKAGKIIWKIICITITITLLFMAYKIYSKNNYNENIIVEILILKETKE